jgi:hypothetical protein
VVVKYLLPLIFAELFDPNDDLGFVKDREGGLL